MAQGQRNPSAQAASSTRSARLEHEGMVEYTVECQSCPASAVAVAGETLFNRQLYYHISVLCPACGAALELDGDGIPPAEMQQLLINHGGLWTLWVDDSAGRTRTMKALREIFDWSLSEVFQRTGSPQNPLYSGTRTEAEWYQQQLEQRGISSDVRPATAAD